MTCNLCGNQDKKIIIEENGWVLVHCLKCGLLFLDPQPDKEQLARLYSPEENYLAQRLGGETAFTRWENTRNNHLARLVGSPPAVGARLLDIGCATGLFLIRVREMNWQVQGIEIGAHTAEYARQTYKLDVHPGGAEDILEEFGPQSFDAITLWDVIEHVQNPLDALHKIYQVLKPGGKLYLATPNADGWVAQYHLRTTARWWGCWPHPEPPYHLYQFTRTTMRQAIEKAGFTSVAFDFDEIPLWYTCGYMGEPGLKRLVQGPVLIPHGRLVYLITWPVYLAARWFRRGDSMIVTAVKPSGQ